MTRSELRRGRRGQMYDAATNRQGMKFVLTGVVLGLFASFGFARVMTGFVYGIKPTDALTFALTPVLLCMVANLAPALRAASIDLASALREE